MQTPSVIRLTLALGVAAGVGWGGMGVARGDHSTCGLMEPVPGEAVVEAVILAHLKAQPPTVFEDNVTVGKVLGQKVKVHAKATIQKPTALDIACGQSRFGYRFDLDLKVSGKAGSTTHRGSGRITGHYLAFSQPNTLQVCVQNLTLAGLDLSGVQNDVDRWLRRSINNSGMLTNYPCLSVPKPM